MIELLTDRTNINLNVVDCDGSERTALLLVAQKLEENTKKNSVAKPPPAAIWDDVTSPAPERSNIEYKNLCLTFMYWPHYNRTDDVDRYRKFLEILVSNRGRRRRYLTLTIKTVPKTPHSTTSVSLVLNDVTHLPPYTFNKKYHR